MGALMNENIRIMAAGPASVYHANGLICMEKTHNPVQNRISPK
jgi:hypothetical protein